MVIEMASPVFPSLTFPWIEAVEVPQLRPVRLPFQEQPSLPFPALSVEEALDRSRRLAVLAPGSRVAVAVGSRGIAGLVEVVSTAVSWLKRKGLKPFIVPAMGSHGGATARGQADLLASLGVTPESVGAPVEATMETVDFGMTEYDIRCVFDRHAAAADAVLLINRVKAHTSFDRPVESGLVKMIAVGLGKAEGARNVHRLGVKGLAEVLPALAKRALERAPIAYGLALVENQSKELAKVEGVEPEGFFRAEERLLKEAKESMARLPFDQLDVLVVLQMGKNVSGIGMDYAVTGRTDIRGLANPPRPFASKLAVLRLTPESHGNAMGLGVADFTTKALVESLDLVSLYTNALTATFVEKAKLPLVLATEKAAVQAALATCWRREGEPVRMAFIKSTLDLGVMWVSEPLAEELDVHHAAESIGPFQPVPFNRNGEVGEIF